MDSNANGHAATITVDGVKAGPTTPAAYAVASNVLAAWGIGGGASNSYTDGAGTVWANSATATLAGLVGVLLIFPGVLSDADRHAWETYAAGRVGATMAA